MNKFFAYIKTDTFRKNLLIAVGSVAAFIALIFISLRFYTRHGENIPVPGLKGMPVERAVQLLESQGFKYKLDSIYLPDKAPGLVVEQDPDHNTSVKRNRTIYLTIITRNAPDVDFPEIIGLSFLEARTMLQNFALKLGDTTYASDIARDRILQASFGGVAIKKGQPVPKGSKIDLILGDGKGASEVDLPDLIGSTLSEASFSLRGSSLELGQVSYEGTLTDTIGAKVIKQFPALSDSLTKVTIGTRVDIILSNDPPPVKPVP